MRVILGLKFDILMTMDPEVTKPNLAEIGNMRPSIVRDRKFSGILDNLITRERGDFTTCFTPAGATLFDTPDFQDRLNKYVVYSRSFNEYLDDLTHGNKKPEDQYSYKEGERSGVRAKLGKSGVEGQVYVFPPYVVKETRSDYLERVNSDKYIPFTQLESLMVMEGLRPIFAQLTGGLVAIPEHFGVVSFELPSRNIFRKPKVELMIMEKIGDEKGTTVEDVERGKAYKDLKTKLGEKAKEALRLLKVGTAHELPTGVFRDLGSHNLLVNPEGLSDDTRPLFFLIDQ